MDLLRAIRKRKKRHKDFRNSEKHCPNKSKFITVFRILLSRYLVFEGVSVFEGSIKNRSFFTYVPYLRDESGESRDPKRGVPSVSNDVDRLRVRKFEGKFCFEFVRVLLRVSPHQFIQPRGKLQT